MTEPKFTPGPWAAVPTTFGPIDIVLSDGRDVVTVYGGGTGNKKANANLIAAAPKLYAVALKTIELIENGKIRVRESEMEALLDLAKDANQALFEASSE